MTYALIQFCDGAYTVVKSGMNDLENAKKWFHHYCEALYGDPNFTVARLELIDENLNSVEGNKYKETIDRRPAPEPVEAA